MRILQLFECEDCGTTMRSDPVACDDWGGYRRAVGPDCPECGCEMQPVNEHGADATTPKED